MRGLKGASALRMVVTTGRERSLAHDLDARDLAARHGLAYTPRSNRPLPALAGDSGAQVVGIFGAEGLVLWRDGVKLKFTAGMAELRIKRVLEGAHEPLVALGELRSGDVVLDGTLGLARDALVMAASGARVEGFEATPVLAAFCEAGLRAVGGAAGTVSHRVQVIRANHAVALAQREPRSADVVYLDPMFTEAVAMPPEYVLFRELADPAPLTPETVAAARRVARRAVLIKDGPRGNLVKHLGVRLRALTFGNRVRYARIDPL